MPCSRKLIVIFCELHASWELADLGSAIAIPRNSRDKVFRFIALEFLLNLAILIYGICRCWSQGVCIYANKLPSRDGRFDTLLTELSLVASRFGPPVRPV